MQDRDDRAFAMVMGGLAKAFQVEEPEPITVDIYFNALRDLSIDAIKKAAAKLVQTRVYKSFPLAAEIREAADGVGRKDRPILAWVTVKKEIKARWEFEKHSVDDPIAMAVVESMGGWPWLHSRSSRDLDFDQKRFEELYAAYMRNPDKLVGIAGPRGGSVSMLGNVVKELSAGREG